MKEVKVKVLSDFPVVLKTSCKLVKKILGT